MPGLGVLDLDTIPTKTHTPALLPLHPSGLPFFLRHMFLPRPLLPASVGPGSPRPRTLPISCPGAQIGATGVRPGSLSQSSMSPPISILKRFWRGTRSRRWVEADYHARLYSTQVGQLRRLRHVLRDRIGEAAPRLSVLDHQFPARFYPLVNDDCDIPAKRIRRDESPAVLSESANSGADASTSLYVRCSSSCPSQAQIPLLGVSPHLSLSPTRASPSPTSSVLGGFVFFQVCSSLSLSEPWESLPNVARGQAYSASLHRFHLGADFYSCWRWACRRPSHSGPEPHVGY